MRSSSSCSARTTVALNAHCCASNSTRAQASTPVVTTDYGRDPLAALFSRSAGRFVDIAPTIPQQLRIPLPATATREFAVVSLLPVR